MDEDSDRLYVKCVLTTNAYFATANGFETILESENRDEYSSIKDRIDEINNGINLDKLLHDVQIKRSIHGRAAYEIIKDSQGLRKWRIPLQSTQITPDLDEAWNLIGYTYQGCPQIAVVR